MQNVDMKRDGTKLIITVDLSKSFDQSSSGKSIIIASTGGNVGAPGNEDVKVGLNVYRKA